MTVPGKGETTKLSTGAEDPAGQTPPLQKRQVRDLIPPWLLIGIFAFVMMGTWLLLNQNWVTEMTRFRSIKAIQNHEWAKSVELLTRLREAGAEANEPMVENSPTYLSELAYSYLMMKKYDEALKYYELAQEHRTNIPTDDQGNPRPAPDFQTKLGLVHFQMGNLDEAEKYLQDALKLNKLDAEANFTRGRIAMQHGQYVEAADYFKTVASNPYYEDRVKEYYAEIEQKLFAGIN